MIDSTTSSDITASLNGSGLSTRSPTKILIIGAGWLYPDDTNNGIPS